MANEKPKLREVDKLGLVIQSWPMGLFVPAMTFFYGKILTDSSLTALALAVGAFAGWLLIAVNNVSGWKRWAAIVVLVGICFHGSFLWYKKYPAKKADKTPSPAVAAQPAPSPTAQEINLNLIRNGGFEQGSNGLKEWRRWEYGNEVTEAIPVEYISNDSGAATGPTAELASISKTPHVISSVPGVGQHQSRGLYINSTFKPSEGRYAKLVQKIYNLEAGKKYEIKFFFYRAEGAVVNNASLFFALGDQPDKWVTGVNKKEFFDQERPDGWGAVILTNPTQIENNFYIGVDAITKGLYIDDISMKEV